MSIKRIKAISVEELEIDENGNTVMVMVLRPETPIDYAFAKSVGCDGTDFIVEE